MIVDILPQKTRFARGGEGGDQVIAANIDTVFIVTAAGRDLNARRIERYLALAHASGARPVVVINKSDLADDPATLAAELAAVSPGTPVVPISAMSGEGVDRLAPYLSPRTTVALIGSSGVGKSTLINRLMGCPVQETSDVRDYDERGRHTTTVRQLFVLEGGALMIDNPGLSPRRSPRSSNSRRGAGSRTAGTRRNPVVRCRRPSRPGPSLRHGWRVSSGSCGNSRSKRRKRRSGL